MKTEHKNIRIKFSPKIKNYVHSPDYKSLAQHRNHSFPVKARVFQSTLLCEAETGTYFLWSSMGAAIICAVYSALNAFHFRLSMFCRNRLKYLGIAFFKSDVC